MPFGTEKIASAILRLIQTDIHFQAEHCYQTLHLVNIRLLLDNAFSVDKTIQQQLQTKSASNLGFIISIITFNT